MSSSFDDNFDYLTLLGLDPARLEVQPRDEVREIINRRKKEWTAQAINPLYQQQARANLERARQFEQILDSPDALQAYVGFQNAARFERRQRQEQSIAELVGLAVGSGRKEITAEQYALLLKAGEDRDVPADVLDGVLRARRLTIREGETAALINGIPYQEPALDRTLMTQIVNHLRVLGKASFYELLDLPVTAAPAKIISTAQILFDRWSKTLPKTSECVAWEKSLQACLTYVKDSPSKSRYDHALFNRRLDEFLARVDLLLAAGRFTREDFTLLATVGVNEFGLTNELVNQCIRWRAGSKGLSLSKAVQVNVSTSGLMKCQRCFRHVAQGDRRCRHCGCVFDLHCRNPACGRALQADARSCDHCGLAVGRGVQYVELLRLAQSLLAIGDSSGTLEAGRLAQQILPSSQIDELTARAGKVRMLTASIRRAAADRRWSRVEREMSDLLTLSPNFSQSGCPRIDEVTRFLAQLRMVLSQVPADAAPEVEARGCLDVLEKWSDCETVLPRLERLLRTLESSGAFGPALEIVQRLATLEPLKEEWQVSLVRLRHKLAEDRQHSLQGLAPAPPQDVSVAVHGTRRVVTWRPAEAQSATMWVVERSVQRAGGRGPEGAWTTLFKGATCGFVDEEVLHVGSIIRYAVHAVSEGSLLVGSDASQAYSVSSLPAFAEPVLLWQEVLGLRANHREEGLELTWHSPAGVRQVLVERWVGGRDDRPNQPEFLPVAQGNRLWASRSEEGRPVCYRVFGVYDGPNGDFLTPGTIVTLVEGAEAKIESARSSDGPFAKTPEFVDVLSQAAVAGPGSNNNPLKRMGIWPPVPKTG